MDEQRPARPADVDRICADLPETEFGTSWGDVPTWKVPTGPKGRGFVLYRKPHKTATDPTTGDLYDDLLVIHTADRGAKEALVQGDSPFFTIDHFRRTNAVLIQQSRLGELTLGELREVITEAWLAVAPAKLVRHYLGQP